MSVKGLENNGRVRDCAFLLLLVVISALPYQFGLGYYSDDWNTKAVLAHAESHGLPAMFHELLTYDSDMLVRPGQYVYLVLGFKLFGQNPLPYHVINTLEIGICSVLLYVAARTLRQSRIVALAIAASWSMLPQFSTDRLWISSQQASLSIAFALAGVVALVRWHENSGRRGNWKWLAAAISAMAVSLLCYEISLGIIVAALSISVWLKWRRAMQAGQPVWKEIGVIGIGIAVLFAVGVLKARMQTRMIYHHHPLRLLSHLGSMARRSLEQSVDFNLWAYGGRMPHVLRALVAQRAISREALVVSLLVAIGAAVYFAVQLRSEELPNLRASLLLIGAGFVLFWLGTGLFLNKLDMEFATTGTDNRISMAAAIGAACVLVGVVSAACGAIPSENARTNAFAALLGFVCAVNCLVVNGIAHHWVVAAAKQQVVLSSVRANVPQLPHSSVLLLDGFCRYVGPGAIFDTDWDTTGALRLLTGDTTVRGDVMSNDLAAEKDAVRATVPDEDQRTYFYGSRLYIYNVRTSRFSELKDSRTAEEYFRPENRPAMEQCPYGHEGRGTAIF